MRKIKSKEDMLNYIRPGDYVMLNTRSHILNLHEPFEATDGGNLIRFRFREDRGIWGLRTESNRSSMLGTAVMVESVPPTSGITRIDCRSQNDGTLIAFPACVINYVIKPEDPEWRSEWS